MRQLLILAVSLTSCAYCAAQENVDALLAGNLPQIQEQVTKTYAAFTRPGAQAGSNVEFFREVQTLKELGKDQDQLMKQLAIFVVTTKSEEGIHVLFSLLLWRNLEVSPAATIRVLAPHLESDNEPLRSFARDVFESLDKADSGDWDAANYKEFGRYVNWSVNRNREIPTPFIKYIYERSPGGALVAFAKGTNNLSARLRAIGTSIAARNEGRELTEQERQDIRQTQAESKRKGLENREIVLAEHIISNAIWLNQNKFDARFHAALPEAIVELEKLSKHKEWWARLYVVYVMRQQPKLRKDATLRQLADDENPLVREAAASYKVGKTPRN